MILLCKNWESIFSTEILLRENFHFGKNLGLQKQPNMFSMSLGNVLNIGVFLRKCKNDKYNPMP